MKQIVIIAHNLRSTHNIGSLFRTAEGLGIDKIYLTGYTPYPLAPKDTRLPHQAAKLTRQIHKTALGAETMVPWKHTENIEDVLGTLRKDGYTVCGLEQTPASIPLPEFQPSEKVAIILGREVEGLEPSVMALCDLCIEIPMLGKKESFNVVQAAAMTLYHCRYVNFD